MAAPPPMQTPDDDRQGIYLRLSAQKALLGAIGPSVRAIAVAYRGQTVRFEALIDADAIVDEREALEVAATDVIADYPPGWFLEVSIRDGADDDVAALWRVYQRLSN